MLLNSGNILQNIKVTEPIYRFCVIANDITVQWYFRSTISRCTDMIILFNSKTIRYKTRTNSNNVHHFYNNEFTGKLGLIGQ